MSDKRITVNKLRNSATYCYSLLTLEGFQKRLFQLTIGVLFHSLNSLFSANGQSVGLTSGKVDFFYTSCFFQVFCRCR